MPRISGLTTHTLDARILLADPAFEKRYRLIYGDAFSDMSIPYHLTTAEFIKLVSNHLEEEGYYVVNVIDSLEPGLFVSAYLKTLSITFDQVYLFEPQPKTSDQHGRRTLVIVAGRHPLPKNELMRVAAESKFPWDITFQPFGDKTKELFNKKTPTLTDDFAPVDNLIAPVFAAMQ